MQRAFARVVFSAADVAGVQGVVAGATFQAQSFAIENADAIVVALALAA